jgi:hypothetical protein
VLAFHDNPDLRSIAFIGDGIFALPEVADLDRMVGQIRQKRLESSGTVAPSQYSSKGPSAKK